MSSAPKHESLMHKLKEKLFHGDKVADADWDTSYAKFRNLTDSMHKLKAGAHNYAASMHSVFLNSNCTAVEFSGLLEDAAHPNEFQAPVQELRAAHAQLNSDKQQALMTKLQEQVLQPIDTHLQSINQVNVKVTQRNELHENLEYYITKVNALNKDRDERSSKGKAETQAQIDKHDRNIVKLDAARSDYTSFVTTLMADLNTAWSTRVSVLGPAMTSFVEVERGFVELYGHSLGMIHLGASQMTPGIAITPAAQVQTPGVAQSAMSPMPPAATNDSSSVQHVEQASAPVGIPYAQPASTAPASHDQQQNPFVETPVHAQQQQQQQAPPQSVVPQEIAAGGVQSGAPIEAANPFDKSAVSHEGAQESIPAPSAKSEYEEESKRQRFAEEQKQQQQAQQQA